MSTSTTARLKTFLPIAGLALLGLGGCAIQQKVSPVSALESKEICVRENDKVRDGFLDSYRSALERRGYRVRLLTPNAPQDACRVTSTYTASWRWDLASYMAYAEIRVYKDGQLAGEAIYDSRRGGGNLGKFISADTKIRELADQLFGNARDGS